MVLKVQLHHTSALRSQTQSNVRLKHQGYITDCKSSLHQDTTEFSLSSMALSPSSPPLLFFFQKFKTRYSIYFQPDFTLQLPFRSISSTGLAVCPPLLLLVFHCLLHQRAMTFAPGSYKCQTYLKWWKQPTTGSGNGLISDSYLKTGDITGFSWMSIDREPRQKHYTDLFLRAHQRDPCLLVGSTGPSVVSSQYWAAAARGKSQWGSEVGTHSGISKLPPQSKWSPSVLQTKRSRCLHLQMLTEEDLGRCLYHPWVKMYYIDSKQQVRFRSFNNQQSLMRGMFKMTWEQGNDAGEFTWCFCACNSVREEGCSPSIGCE